MRKSLTLLSLVAAFGLAGPGMAQVRTIDPNQAIDSDLNRPQTTPTPAARPYPSQPDPNQTGPGQPVPSEQPV